MTRIVLIPLLCLAMPAGQAPADPDLRDGMPEPLPASGIVSGTLLPLAGERVSFAVVGDYGSHAGRPDLVAAMIRSWEPEFIVTTGDNTYGPVDYIDIQPATPGVQTGWDENVGRYYGDWIERRADGRYTSLTGTTQRFFPCIGNHDNVTLNATFAGPAVPPPEAGYLDFFHHNPGGKPRLPENRGAVHTDNVSYYAMRRGPVDFFMLDSNQPFLPGGGGTSFVQSQNEWLEQEAGASTAPWKLAVFHHPPPRAFQLQWEWIPPARMQLCNAALCGHDHVYERFVWNGVPVLVTGNGGAGNFTRLQPDYPDTLAVDDRHLGAIKAQAGDEYLEFEARSVVAATGEEFLADRYVLGNAAAIPDMDDEYWFYADAGETVTFETLTDSPALDPKLTLYGPDGRVFTSDSGSASDGRNARISALIPAAGRWKLRIVPETESGGAYQIRARLVRPGMSFAEWSGRLPPGRRGPYDDARGDGIPNLAAFALTPFNAKRPGSGLEVVAVPGAAIVRLTLPALLRQGVSLAIESSSDPAATVWATVAERNPFAAWRSPTDATLIASPLPGGRQLFQAVVRTGSAKQFFRLRVSLVPET